MAGEWQEVQLGEVAALMTGYPFKSQHYTDDVDAPRLIGGDNIAQGNLRWESVRRWPRDMTEGLDDYWLEPGDVVLAMDRPWIDAGLKRAAVGLQDVPSLLIQRTARLRGTDELDTAFLRYVVGSQAFAQYILSVQTGTAVPHISPAQIRAFGFLLPPMAEQRAIAHVLGTLDEKIELNRRRNQTLDAKARALFKDWFVDFGPVRAKMEGREPYLPPDLWQRFPDRLDDEGKPEEWNERPLDEVANFLNGLALQKFPAIDPDDSLPVIKIAELRNGVSAKSDRASRDVPAKYIIKDGDFLFSWSGSLLAKFWTENEGALNQHLFKVTSAHYPMWFVSHWVHHHLEEFQAIAASKATTMGHIQRGHLKAAMTLCPPGDVLARLGVVMAPLVQQAIHNELESRNLSQLRDTLLPKLISGEFRIADAEHFMDRVEGEAT